MKKMILLSGSMLLLTLIIFGYFKYKYNQTFNDAASMEAKIAIELEIEQVSVFDIQVDKEYRLVGFAYKTS